MRERERASSKFEIHTVMSDKKRSRSSAHVGSVRKVDYRFACPIAEK